MVMGIAAHTVVVDALIDVVVSVRIVGGSNHASNGRASPRALAAAANYCAKRGTAYRPPHRPAHYRSLAA